ncbi:MAG: glycosyltransferase family 2 protein, partial [FCB group bacterium]|nr:glycosyltransferase family 2 protein [FCB group bacterium]
MQVDFVIPVYNERDTLGTLTAGILEHAAPHTVRIIFVDDGSNDGSADVLRTLAEAHPEVEAVRFRRNFGKAAGLAAGFARAGGDVVFTMDADLQDDPAEIPHFLAKLEEGFDIVVGWKEKCH